MPRRGLFVGFALAWLLVISQSLFAQTSLPATIGSSTTLSLQGSPYIANQDVTVLDNVLLTVEAGVEIQFVSNAGLFVNGGLKMLGTANNPINLKPANGHSSWKVVSINKSDFACELKYVTIRKSTKGNNLDRDRAAISVRNSSIVIDNCDIRDGEAPVFIFACNNALVSNSIFHSNVKCDYVNFLESNGTIEYNTFIGSDAPNTDAIDFDASQGVIIGNYLSNFTGFNTDAIDIGGALSSAVIQYNIIEDIFDKGISIGERAFAQIDFNLIVRTAAGIASKDLAVVNGTNNTFFQNDASLQAFSADDVGWGGGEMYMRNCIIFESSEPISSRDNSTLSLTYSLCDNRSLQGNGNILGNPLFVDAPAGDFNLLENSPAIDSGDPGSPVDLDGSRADMGAYPFSRFINIGLKISELLYRPYIDSNYNDDYEFIELLNISSSEIDLSGFRFDKGISFVFPFGTEILPNEYILLVRNINSYLSVNAKVFQWWDGRLDDNGEVVRIINRDDKTVIDLEYSSDHPWPEIPEYTNFSIQLVDTELDFTKGGNWKISVNPGGTPGATNEALIEGIVINEVLSKSTISFPDDNGDPSDWIEIYNNALQPINIGGLFVSDNLDEPDLYEIPGSSPSSTTIPSGGYLLLYASGDSDKGIFHLPITLQSSGEQFGIFQLYNGEYRSLDFVTFPQMAEGESYGRIPDGSGAFIVLEKPSPGMPNEVRSADEYSSLKINELVAKFDDSYPDEHGLHSDWIEIFNSGMEAVNMAGLYFSDRDSDPKVHRIPVNIGDSAIIEPGGFLVFRPDSRPDLGYNHLDFELASSGEEVILSVEISGEVVVIDQKTYQRQVQGKSYGRLGDGGKWWAIFGNPTPDAPNSATSVAVVEYDQMELIVYPNPVKDVLTIFLSGETNGIEVVEVFDMHGEKWKTWYKEDLKTPLRLELNTRSDAIPSGVYVIRLTGSGKSITKRFIIQ